MCSLLLSAAQGIETLEAEIVLLREKNRRLGEGRPSGNIKTLVFGDITGSKKKFEPDDELILDIPLPTPLPI